IRAPQRSGWIMLQCLVAGRERRIFVRTEHPAHKCVEASDALRVPDLFDLVSQPESAHQIKAQLENLSLENMSQALHLGSVDLERLRELLNQVRLLGIGFPVDEGHHDESLHQLLSELRIGKHPSQL